MDTRATRPLHIIRYPESMLALASQTAMHNTRGSGGAPVKPEPHLQQQQDRMLKDASAGLVNLPLGSISTMPVLIADEITVAFILSRDKMRAIATCCVCQPISKRVAYGGGRERQAPTDNLARPGLRVHPATACAYRASGTATYRPKGLTQLSSRELPRGPTDVAPIVHERSRRQPVGREVTMNATTRTTMATVCVPQSRLVVDGHFIQYEVCAAWGARSTSAWRRFNDFKGLDAALRASAVADVPELPSASFFARYGITATDVDERRVRLQGYMQEVLTLVDVESSERLRDFLALQEPADEPSPSDDEECDSPAGPLVRQRSASIDVPALAARSSAAHILAGSPFAISPPDEFHGGGGGQGQGEEDGGEAFDLVATWVLLEDSDDEVDETPPSTTPSEAEAQSALDLSGVASHEASSSGGGAETAGSSPSASPTRREKKETRKKKQEQKQQAARVPPAPSVVRTVTTQPPRRSYVADARASVLIGEPLPPEPTKLQMVAWLQRNASPAFLREHKLTGDPRAVANARSRDALADAYYLALVAKVPVEKLESLVFDTMDSDLDERVSVLNLIR